MLEDIFRMQLELNDYVFKKNNLKNKSGDILNMQAIITAVKNEDMMVNDLPNKWLVNYSKAMKEELSELDECQISTSDINEDGVVNVVDIVNLVIIILDF